MSKWCGTSSDYSNIISELYEYSTLIPLIFLTKLNRKTQHNIHHSFCNVSSEDISATQTLQAGGHCPLLVYMGSVCTVCELDRKSLVSLLSHVL